jgi:hypothetical protein
MVTHADVALKGERAELRQSGKFLLAQLLAPAGAVFEVAPANPPDDGVNAPNPNTRILSVNVLAPTDGKLRVEVKLQPE